MKNVPAYEIDRLSHAQLLERRLETQLKLAPRMFLPTTASDMGVYVEELLSAAEEEVCNRATD
jgi:hypothetical protein